LLLYKNNRHGTYCTYGTVRSTARLALLSPLAPFDTIVQLADCGSFFEKIKNKNICILILLRVHTNSYLQKHFLQMVLHRDRKNSIAITIYFFGTAQLVIG
jgi:hypothetical protein